MVTYLMVIRWTVRGEDGFPVSQEYRADVTDSIVDGADAEDLTENAGYKIQESAGDSFIEFTAGYVATI